MGTRLDPRLASEYEVEHRHGGMSKWAMEDDPKRIAFTAARYKHTAKLLEGKKVVLEVGCSDGYWSRIVKQHVARLDAIDPDKQAINEARFNFSEKWPINFYTSTLESWCGAEYDAVYALDVLEHIRPDNVFLDALYDKAPVAVIGMPSSESQKYASELSRQGHVNCYSGKALKRRLGLLWKHVFLFTIHDETLGTSFPPMAHYLLALCVK